MKTYHIINPAAGCGGAEAACRRRAEKDAVVYRTTGVGDARRYLAQVLKDEREECRVYVYGGDGTIGEAVNGIMDADAAEIAALTAVPVGTGNDFVRMFDSKGTAREYKLDLLRCGDLYAVNMVNIGFDCSVVSKTAEWKKKPFISGAFAYILGIISVLLRRLGTEMVIEYTDEEGIAHTESGTLLLCAIGNAQYYGGGFRAAPIASMEDGLIDLLVVKRVTRLRFLGLVGLYRVGAHIKETGETVDRVKDVLSYIRCRSIKISGIKEACFDGEVRPTSSFTCEVLPRTLRYMTEGKIDGSIVHGG